MNDVNQLRIYIALPLKNEQAVCVDRKITGLNPEALFVRRPEHDWLLSSWIDILFQRYQVESRQSCHKALLTYRGLCA